MWWCIFNSNSIQSSTVSPCVGGFGYAVSWSSPPLLYCVWHPWQLNKLLQGLSQSAAERTDPCKSHPPTGCHAVKSLIRNPALLDWAEHRQGRAPTSSAICSDWKLLQTHKYLLDKQKTWKATAFCIDLYVAFSFSFSSWPEWSVFE